MVKEETTTTTEITNKEETEEETEVITKEDTITEVIIKVIIKTKDNSSEIMELQLKELTEDNNK